MHKALLLVAITFLTAPLTQAESATNYLFLSSDGKYPQAKKNFLRHILNVQKNNAEPYQVTQILSQALRDAVTFSDAQFYSTVEKEIFKHFRLLQKEETSSARSQRIKLFLLRELSELSFDISQERKFEIIKSHSDLNYWQFLVDYEYVFACNMRIEFFARSGMPEAALVEANVCMAVASSFNNIAPGDALNLMASYAYAKILNGHRSSDNLLLSAIDEITNSGTLNLADPSTLDALSKLSRTEAIRGSPFVSSILNAANNLIGQGIHLSNRQKANIQWGYEQVHSQWGLDAIPRLDIELSPVDRTLVYQQKLISNFSQGSKHKILTPDDNFETKLSKLSELVTKSKINHEEIIDEVISISKLQTAWKMEEENFLKFEKSPTSFEAWLRITALNAAVKTDYRLPSRTQGELFSFIFSSQSYSDLRNKIFGNEFLSASAMSEIPTTYLKLAKDLNRKASEFSQILARKAIDLVNRNYTYKDRDKTTDDSKFFDFLNDHKELRDVVWHFNWLTDNAYSESMTKQDVSISEIQSAINSEQIIVAYKRVKPPNTDEIIFKCSITKVNFGCEAIIAPENFQNNLKTFRAEVVEEKGSSVDLDNGSIIFEALFPKANYSNFTEILLYPDQRDLSLPFNALTGPGKQYFGLSHNFYLLTSLFPIIDKRETVKKSKLYLGLGNPSFKSEVSIDANLSDIFRLRSGEQIEEVTNLIALPETGDEILEVAKSLGKSQKTLLLGEEATELNLRLAVPGDHRFLHFATHGLTSGSFEGKREPALALSIDENASNTFNDALLTESEILELKLYGSSVFLSACETASDFGAGAFSGFGGLAQSFLLAGANEVTATQWKIESNSAAKIVSSSVQNSIKDSNSKISPIRKALINYHEDVDENPYYWAPFIVFRTLIKPNNTIFDLDIKSQQIDPMADEYRRYEPLEVFEVNGQIYVTATYASPRTKDSFRNFIFNVSSHEVIWLPEDVGTPTLYKSQQNAVTFFAQKKPLGDPTLIEVNLQNKEIDEIFTIDLLNEFHSILDGEKNIVGAMVAKNIIPDRDFSVIINLLPSYDHPDFKSASQKLNQHWLLVINEQGTITKKIRLPDKAIERSLRPRHMFINNDLYMSISAWDPKVQNKFDTTWGIRGNESKTLNLFKFDEEKGDWETKRKFNEISFFRPILGSQILVEEGTTGAVFSRFYDLDSDTLGERLPVTSGSATVDGFKLNNGHIYFGDLKIPATFRDLSLSAKSRASPSISPLDYLNDPNTFLSPEDNWLRFILYQNAQGELFNVNLEFSRLMAFYSDYLVLENEIYFFGKKERDNIYLEKFLMSDFERQIEYEAELKN